MGKPAARAGDWHECPMVESVSGKLHLGGSIVEGNETVLIGGKPAATVGDACMCVGGVDTITSGSTGVFIGGKPAARRGDGCAHGGIIMGGLGTVLIGERGGRGFSPEEKNTAEENELLDELTLEEKNRQISTAINNCIVLLERKLQLLECRDEITMNAFEKWFGVVNEEEVQVIIFRIQNALNVAKVLTIENFKVVVDERARPKTYAIVYSEDEFHTFFLGDLFWNKNFVTKRPQELVLVHELSHFDYVGMASDFDYGTKQCLNLVEQNHKMALFNADNFEYFIQS